MATIMKFEDIEAWQKARVLAEEIFKLCNETALSKDFRFCDQINAAVGSVRIILLKDLKEAED